jgi:multidrug efflux system membrane fusion protein
MTLSENGRVGVRTVSDKVVAFAPVEIVGGTVDGIWVTGLPDEVAIITVGQEFVIEGQTVKVETPS